MPKRDDCKPSDSSYGHANIDKSPNSDSVSVSDGYIDLRELFETIWLGKWLIALFTFLFSICSVVYALSLPNVYTSTAVLLPVDASKGGGLSELARQFGGVASLAGFNLGSGSGTKSTEAIEVLQSWSFLEDFIKEEGIAAEVIAVNGWDQDSNQLLYNESLYDVEEQIWVREPEKGKGVEPSSWELYEKFSSFLRVTKDKSSNFIHIEIQHFSPHFAKKLVDSLVEKINNMFRERDTAEAIKNIEFLKKQINTTHIASMQTVFYDLIEDQTKTLMLADVQSEYVFRTVNEARVPELRSKPNRVFICILGAVLGSFFGVIFVVVFRSSSRKKESN